MHKRTKALAIPKKVKEAVYERDEGRCILCHKPGDPVCHYISRAQGGLGIEQNIFTGCIDCHRAYDGSQRKELRQRIKQYLDDLYPDFTDDMRTYRKYTF